MFPDKQGLYSSEFEHDNCGAGFICSLQGKKTNDIIHKALDILCKLEHRGAVSSDGKTGDGAGILIEIPHEFFKNTCDFKLPNIGEYAVGMVFLPQKQNQRTYCIGVFESEINNSESQQTHLYIPSSLQSFNSPEKGASVPCSCVT